MEATKAIGWHSEFDILVVGSGNGAMTAGIVAHDGGAKVLLVESLITLEELVLLLVEVFGFLIIDMQ